MDEIGQRLKAALAGRYSVEREVGAGGMALVYLADDTRHHRRVAVKVLRPDLAAALGASRFLREIEIAAQLTHPHILPLYDSGEADGLLYYVMPFVEGESLRGRLVTDGKLSVADAVRLLRDIVDALAYAHERGVVHRDIKPDNVMLSGRHALVTDFGVAKAVSDAGKGSSLTTAGVSLGTPTYMAPEQATADPTVDHRADIYAVGVMAFEMLTGAPPFTGDAQSVMVAHVTSPVPAVQRLRGDVPPELAAAVTRCLAKRPEERYQSADDLLAELDRLATPGSGTTPVGSAPVAARRGRRSLVMVAGVLVLVAAGGGAVRHFSRIQWARAQALPQIRALADSFDLEGAWVLAQRVERIVPDDTILASLWPRFSRTINITSEPAGARVLRRAFAGADTAWHELGATPLDSVRLPSGASYLRLEKDGFQPLQALVSGGGADWRFALDSGRGPDAGMVVVPGGHMQELNLPSLEGLGNVDVETFRMDAHEVTNRQFKEFVDSGGYRRREFWDQPFVLDGRPLAWDAAMARFMDRTGRPGPATWEAGDFPAGQAEYPVGGVSWYEAVAYAKFRGKSLPTIFHWVRAARTTSAAFIVPRSNVEGRGPAPVGSFHDVGPYGAWDMAGNVREWCANDAGGSRYILGGGWNDPGYAFNDAYTQPPFDRSVANGIRLVRYRDGDSTLAALSRPVTLPARDFARERAVPDAIYQVYRRLFDYDPRPLRAVVEATDSSSDEFILERVTYAAAYGDERIIGYLWRPRRGTPPFQTVIYFPGSNALNLRTFDPVSRVRIFDFFLKSGRAVLVPVYKSTHERGDGFETDIADMSSAYRDHVIMWVKDFRRSVDYLATRADVDTSRLAYYGISWGGYLGGLIPAVEPRIKVVLLQVAGLEIQRASPEVEPFNYLPRITQPVLMLNGRYDHYFPVETSQLPFFRALGTPAAHKRQVIAEGGHFVPRNQIIGETLAWLDRYLGPVR